jgi:Holliday junction resolvase RusA-like endonuclease
MHTVHIVIEGAPQVWSRPRACIRGGKVAMFDPKTAERKKLGISLKQHFPKPLEGPIKLELCFYFAIKDKKKWGEYKTSRSDLDNLVKSAGDMLNSIAYVDDAQIVSLTASKKYSEKGSTHIFVSQM